MSQLRKILAIDGGGIRGIIPATILDALEVLADRPTAQLFDLIAGTSTGGILALALTKPNGIGGKPEYRATQLAAMYKTEGPTIFPHPVWASIRMLHEVRYPSSGIESILERYLGAAKLNEAITKVLVPAYDIEQRNPFFFKSWKNSAKDFLMKDVGRATSAAPTYFEPAKVTAGSTYYALVDGGVFANNPAVCAYTEARSLWPDDDLMVVSLGTGSLTKRYPYEAAKGWGALHWARPVLDIIMDGQSETADYNLSQILTPKIGEKIPQRYYRLQASLDKAMDDMDDATASNVHMLEVMARDIAHKHEGDLELIAKQLLG